jgi:hypothetical protein
MVVRTIVVSVTDNKVKNVCKFLDLIEGVVEYNVAGEELGTIDKQPTNSTKPKIKPCLGCNKNHCSCTMNCCAETDYKWFKPA